MWAKTVQGSAGGSGDTVKTGTGSFTSGVVREEIEIDTGLSYINHFSLIWKFTTPNASYPDATGMMTYPAATNRSRYCTTFGIYNASTNGGVANMNEQSGANPYMMVSVIDGKVKIKNTNAAAYALNDFVWFAD